MAERYLKHFSLEKNLYSPGSPLLILAGSLLKDSYTGNMLAQLKLKNIGSAVIKAAKVEVLMLDATGSPINAPTVYQYLDINVARDGEFGSKTAIVLPDGSVRSFAVRVSEAVFADGGVWRGGEGAWLPLKEQKSLRELYGDEELANQFRVRYGADCQYAPTEDADLWLCVCGGVNSVSEGSCHLCRRALSAQKSVNVQALKAECAERLKAEAEQRVKDEELARKKRKKRIVLASVMAPVLAAALLLAMFVPGALKRARAYESAQALIDEHRYEEAAQAFALLGDYRDSAQQAELNIPYQQALYVMDCASRGDRAGLSFAGISADSVSEDDDISLLLYQAAIEQFEALGDHKKALANIALCQEAIKAIELGDIEAAYKEAAELLKSGSYCLAAERFTQLGDYEDSAAQAKEAIYQKALALYKFIGEWDCRGIYASISLSSQEQSVFSVSEARALELGSQFVPALRAACGQDPADIRLEDEPGAELKPLSDCVKALFQSMDDYSDSADYPARIDELLDYTRPFRLMVEEGDVHGAYDWLSAYEDEFQDRDYWLGLLETYKPLCDDWVFYSGDPALVSMVTGRSEAVNSFSSKVIIQEDKAVLRFTISGADGEYTIDYEAELGDTKFINKDDGSFFYYALISQVDHMAYMKYETGGAMRSSSEYSRAG